MGQRRRIAGSRMLITGASQGIGRALAVAAAQQGAKVLAAARQESHLLELAQEVRTQGGTLEIVAADVTSPADRQKMVEAAQRHFGGLDILVNNAGIGATGHFADVDFAILRKIVEVNFFGLTETTRVFLPLLKQGTKPAIVNISSIAGKRGIPARSHYSASKFAVQGFGEALRAELAKDGVDVLVICPGLTQTNFSHNMLEQKAKVKLDHLRGMTAEQVALATLRAIAKGKNEICLSFKGKLLVLFARFFPKVVDFFTKKKVRELFEDEMAQRQRQRAATPPMSWLGKLFATVNAMAKRRQPDPALLVVACFSRHPDALDWAQRRLEETYGPIEHISSDFDFHHTTYYQPTMGVGLKKRFLVFEQLRSADILPPVKNFTIGLENEIASSGRFPDARPLNLDPGLLQLGKFLLATTKDQGHRIYLTDGIYAEVTLRFEGKSFEVWPWTYADYREPAVRDFLALARAGLLERRNR